MGQDVTDSYQRLESPRMKTPSHLNRPRDFGHVSHGLSSEILAALKSGPMHIQALSQTLGREYQHLAGTLKYMRDKGVVVVVGKCGDYDLPGIRKDAPLYGLPGSQKPIAAPVTIAKVPSGNVALPNRGFEFKPLKYDSMALYRLNAERK